MFPLNFLQSCVLLLLITSSFSRPVEDEEGAPEDAKKINDEDVRGVIEDLETIVGKIPLEHFTGDTKLYQVIDTLNDVTSYRAEENGKKESNIYERKSNDKDKKIIILKPSEDKITVRQSKKTYVGLRNSGEGATYYAFYIYIREAKSGDEFAKKIGGEDKLVEYDSWENREDKLQKVNNGFGWSECSSSIFIPCKTNESTGFAPPRVDHRKNKNVTEETDKKKPPKPEGEFKTAAGFEANENIDFFWDLEDDIQKARFFGLKLDLLAGGLTEIPKMLMGVFGGITEGVGGLLSGVVGAGGQLMTSVVGGAMNAFGGMVGAASDLISGALGAVLNMGGSITGGIGANIGLDLGGNFLGGISNMIGQGMNAMTGVMSGFMNAGVGMLNAGVGVMGGMVNAAGQMATGVAGTVMNLVSGMFKMGFGLMNSLLSFGGLGGKGATEANVGLAVGINLNAGGSLMTKEDSQEVEEGIQREASGGLGGLLSLDIDLGDDTSGDQAKGRSIGSNPAEEAEKKEKEGRAMLTLKLAEIISTKMGEEFGKKLLKTGLVDHPGWKTMDEAGEAGNTLTHEDDAFVGFGGCEYHKVTKKDFEEAKSASDHMKLLRTALRTQCVAQGAKFYESLLEDNFLKFNEDEKTFKVPQDNKYLHMDKLTPKRRSDLGRAFEMSLFSKAFKAELLAENPHAAPKHSPVSRRVHTLGEVVIAGIDLVGREFKCHQVKILRNLLTTVKAAFTKLLQDYEATKECEACAEELAVNRNDQTYLMTLMEFILHGLAPVQKNSEEVTQALKTFNETNNEVIKNRVDNYLV